jgi:hypothetical protein
VVRVFAELEEALAAHDAERAAGLVIYPLRVNTAPDKRTEVTDRETFVRDFDRIFTRETVAKVLAIDPRRVVCRANGFFLVPGVLWGRVSHGRHGLWVVNQEEPGADAGARP